MAESFQITGPALNRAVYVSIASVKDDPQLDVLAGITFYTLLRKPNLTTEQIGDGILAVRDAITESSPDLRFDQSPNESMYMSRILTRLVPKLTDPHWRAGSREYTRAFLGSYRRGVNQFRQVASIESQFDQFGEVDRFRRDTWERLHEFASKTPSAATALNQSSISERLGAQTSETAKAMLERTPIQGLSSFVTARLQPDGGLRAELAEMHTEIAGASGRALSLSSTYAQNLFEISRADQAFRDASSIKERRAGAAKSKEDEKKEKTELEKAIEKAKAKQSELDGKVSDVRSGVKGTLTAFAFLAKHSNDPDFAKDIEKFAEVSVAVIDVSRKYSKSAINVAEKVAGLLKLGTAGFSVVSGIGFAAGLVAIGVTIFGMLGKKQKPSIDEEILKQVKRITQQIQDLGEQLNTRFDNIEKLLNAMFESMLEQFARIDFELGQIEGSVEEVQFALYNLQSELQRLNRNIHTFLEAAHRRDLVEAINAFLRFRERTGQDLDFATFLQGENAFFSWGSSHALDPLQAGPPERSFEDQALFNELTNLPLDTNVNFMRVAPNNRFGLPPLSPNRLANPSDWITASEAYCQLSEESPAHALNISSERVEILISVGQSLGASLSKIADKKLFAALANHYRTQFKLLKQELAAFEQEFRNDPKTGLQGIDPWGGANQTPKDHFLAKARELRRCDNRSFGGGINSVNINLPSFDHSQLAPFMIASNIGLDVLDACIAASWFRSSVKPIVGERFDVTFQLIITVTIRYGGAAVFEHRFESNKTVKRVLLRKELDTFTPNTSFGDPHAQVPGLKDQLSGFPVRHSLMNSKLRTAAIAAVEAALKLSQRAFYARVAQRLELAGHPLQKAGEHLSGSKLLWQSFVLMGLPLSSEANELLRSLLFGGESIPAGTDASGEDALLDDVQDIFTFFATRSEEPPPANLVGDIETHLNAGVDTLLTALNDIIDNIATTGEPEPPQLFAPTLLRLSVIESRPTV